MPMKKDLQIHILFFAVLLFAAISCKKSMDSDSRPVNQPGGQRPHADSAAALLTQPIPKVDSAGQAPYPVQANMGCPGAPDYGDSILFLQPMPNGQDYIVKPVNNPGPGTFYSWPLGMQIDSSTGAIDFSKSETGERYTIGFVKQGSTDTCLVSIILAGAAYEDNVYVLSNSQTKAAPYFNANPLLTNVCGSNGNSNGSCNFDVTGSANQARITVDNNTGVIDLQKTLKDGAFGLIPLNGATVQVPIYYRLNDASNDALQSTTIQIMYYYSKSQIPPSLLGNIDGRQNNLLQNLLITIFGRPKPSLIIITRVN
jgi:hypothetical protein